MRPTYCLTLVAWQSSFFFHVVFFPIWSRLTNCYPFTILAKLEYLKLCVIYSLLFSSFFNKVMMTDWLYAFEQQREKENVLIAAPNYRVHILLMLLSCRYNSNHTVNTITVFLGSFHNPCI